MFVPKHLAGIMVPVTVLVDSDPILAEERPLDARIFKQDILRERNRFLENGTPISDPAFEKLFGRLPPSQSSGSFLRSVKKLFFSAPLKALDRTFLKNRVQGLSNCRKSLVQNIYDALKSDRKITFHQYLKLHKYLFEILEPEFFTRDKFITFFNVQFEWNDESFKLENKAELRHMACMARLEIYQIFALNNPRMFQEKLFAHIISDLEKQYVESSANARDLLARAAREDLDLLTGQFLKIHFDDVNLRKNILFYEPEQNFPLINRVLQAGYLPIQYSYDLMRMLHTMGEMKNFKNEFYKNHLPEHETFSQYFLFWNEDSIQKHPLSSQVRAGIDRFVNEHLIKLNHAELLKQLSFVFTFYEYLFFEVGPRGSHRNLLYFMHQLLNHPVIFDVLSHEKTHRLSQATVEDVLLELFVQSNTSVSFSNRLRKIFKTAFLDLSEFLERQELPMRKDQRFEAVLENYSDEEIMAMIAKAKETRVEVSSDRDYSPGAVFVSEDPKDYRRPGYDPERTTYIYYPIIQEKYKLPEIMFVFWNWIKRQSKSKSRVRKEGLKVFLNEFPEKMLKYGVKLKTPLFLDPKSMVFHKELKSKDYKFVD